jgi:hypothetical protein
MPLITILRGSIFFVALVLEKFIIVVCRRFHRA